MSGPEVVVDAVEELLRFLTITHLGRRRTALEDAVVGAVAEHLVPAGIAGEVRRRDLRRPRAPGHLVTRVH
ncbi:hypothetical protein ACFYZB_20835 [Streptomyces sp. NPDC001852]|uniref:hypothetical protein n=1 Tax=Streptomyces sp. NPDC001852 TaxID=3364619 RepID=UPI00367482C0